MYRLMYFAILIAITFQLNCTYHYEAALIRSDNSKDLYPMTLSEELYTEIVGPGTSEPSITFIFGPNKINTTVEASVVETVRLSTYDNTDEPSVIESIAESTVKPSVAERLGPSTSELSVTSIEGPSTIETSVADTETPSTSDVTTELLVKKTVGLSETDTTGEPSDEETEAPSTSDVTTELFVREIVQQITMELSVANIVEQSTIDTSVKLSVTETVGTSLSDTKIELSDGEIEGSSTSEKSNTVTAGTRKTVTSSSDSVKLGTYEPSVSDTIGPNKNDTTEERSDLETVGPIKNETIGKTLVADAETPSTSDVTTELLVKVGLSETDTTGELSDKETEAPSTSDTTFELSVEDTEEPRISEPSVADTEGPSTSDTTGEPSDADTETPSTSETTDTTEPSVKNTEALFTYEQSVSDTVGQSTSEPSVADTEGLSTSDTTVGPSVKDTVAPITSEPSVSETVGPSKSDTADFESNSNINCFIDCNDTIDASTTFYTFASLQPGSMSRIFELCKVSFTFTKLLKNNSGIYECAYNNPVTFKSANLFSSSINLVVMDLEIDMLGSQEILYLNIGQNYTLNCLSNIMTPEVLINDSEFMNTKLFLENEIQSAIYRETDKTANYSGNSASYIITNAKRKDEGRYMCYAMTSSIWKSKVIEVFIKSRNQIDAHFGDSQTLNCPNELNPIWKKNFREILVQKPTKNMPVKEGSYFFQSLTTEDSGNYSCYNSYSRDPMYTYELIVTDPYRGRLFINSNLLEDQILTKLNSSSGQVCTASTNGNDISIDWFGPDKKQIRTRRSDKKFSISVIKYKSERERHLVSVLNIRDLKTRDFGKYQCRVNVEGQFRYDHYDLVENFENIVSSEPEISFLPNEDIFVIPEDEKIKFKCMAIGNQTGLSAIIYKNNIKMIAQKKLKQNSVEILINKVKKSDEGEYMCRVFWIAKLGIRVASKRMTMLVENKIKNAKKEMITLAGSAVNFRCRVKNARWTRITNLEDQNPMNMSSNCIETNSILRCSQLAASDTGLYRCSDFDQELDDRNSKKRRKFIQLNVLPALENPILIDIPNPAIQLSNRGDPIIQVCTVTWTKSNPNSLKLTWRYPDGRMIRNRLGKIVIRTFYSSFDPLVKISELRINDENIHNGYFECRAQVGYRRSAVLFNVTYPPKVYSSKIFPLRKQFAFQRKRPVNIKTDFVNSKMSLKDVALLKVNDEFTLNCDSNRSIDEYPKFEWFYSSVPISSVYFLSYVTAIGNQIVIKNVQEELNGNYFSCRSFLDDYAFIEYIWPVQVDKSGIYAKMNGKKKVQRKVGDKLRLSCYAVSTANRSFKDRMKNINYEWKKVELNGISILSKKRILDFKSLSKQDSGIYSCTTTNSLRNQEKSIIFTEINVG